MNNIYKVIWSKAKNCYVVASEIARSHTKSATGSEKIGGVTRRSLLASLMALSLLCGGLGVATATDVVHVNESATGTAEVYTKAGVDTLLEGKADKTALENKANATDVATNKANIDKNKENITKLENDKLRIDVASATYATKDALDGLTTVVNGKADAADVNNKLANKADAAALGEYAKTADVNNALNAKANKTDLDTANGKITDLQAKTANLSADGKELTGMTTVSGAKVSGDNVEAGALKVIGEISNGAGVTTTLADIKDSMDQTGTNKTWIGRLKDKTTKITYDASNGTSVDGVTFNAGAVTGVTSINGTKIGVQESGEYIHQDNSIWGNLKTVDTQVKTNADAIAKETEDRKAAIGELTVDGKYIKKGMNVSDNLVELDKQAKTNADNIQTNANNIKINKDEIARVNGELVKTNDYFNSELSKTNDYFNSELSKTNNHFNTELGKTNAALQATNKRTAGIERTDTGVAADNQTVIEGKVHFDQNGNVSGVKDLQTDTIHATGEIISKGLNAGAGEITTTGKVSAGDVSTGTLETTGKATIGGNLDVKGTLNIKDVTAETIHVSKSEDNADYKSEGSIIGEGGNLSVSNKKTDKRTNITKESQLNVNEEGAVNWATSTDGTTGNVTEGRSEVTADHIKNSVKKTEGGKTFGYEENITADGKVGTVTDKEGNTSSTRQDSKGIYGYAKDKDGNKSYTKQEGNRIAESVIGQDGKETKSEMTSTDITNTAKDGTITNTAKNVTNEGTESVTNKVGNNEVKVSQNGVDIKAEDGKKITESVGTASRVVENDKITDKAADSTVTTEKGKGTTFGKKGSTGTTNIYGDSIKTGTINARDTTTDKLTAGAAAGAVGGRLTVDADGVQGSYKSGKYTSKSYILANTLKSGVDNGKKPTDADFVGSRTDHYMDGDKAKLDETVKDADGSNVTNKTSTSTKSTIKKGDITTAVNQEGDKIESSIIKDDYSQSNVTTSTVEATANAVTGKDANGNAQTSTVINNKDGLLITNTDNQTSFTTEDRTSTGTAQSWTNIKGNEISTGKVEANYVKMGYADVMKDLGVHGNAKIDGKTTTGSLEVTGTSTLTGDVTMGSNATVKGNFNVKGDTNLKNTKVEGTLNVTQKATFDDSVSIAKDLSVGGDVTANSYKVGDKTYIDKNGIHANGQKITDVADGSISEGSKDAVNGGQLYTVKNDLEGKVNKVGANAAAMANLHPMEFDPDSKWNIAAAIGNYGSETAAALGAFYRPNDDVMVNLSTAFGTGENMVGGGVSVRLGKGGNKLSREESNALKAQVDDLTARMDALLSVLNPNMSKDFPDVPENHWAYEAVSRLAGNDIVQGYPDGEFHGERTMTRYEMAEIIYNALSRGAEAEKELVEEFKPELQAMAASEKATAERAEG